jgi:hypothetical protein
MNKLERKFKDHVLTPAMERGAIEGFWREPIKLRLAGRTTYAPDFLVIEGTARFTFVETKGFMREDANVKLKVAAAMYPVFGWLLVTRDKWGWHVRPVDARGIGRDEITVHWIHGRG